MDSRTASLPRASGIYEIVNLINGKVYVGQALDLRARQGVHWAMLRRNYHHSNHLQNSWNKHGEAAFCMRTLELVDVPKEQSWRTLAAREEYWIEEKKAYLPEKGYNLIRISSGRHILSPEKTALRRERQSAAAKIRNADPVYNKMLRERCKAQHTAGTLNITPASRAKAGAANIGRAVSEETKQKLRNVDKQKRIEAGRKSGAARRLKHTPMSEEAKAKLKKANRDAYYKNEEERLKKIAEMRPRVLKQMSTEVTCPHCNKTGRGPTMYQWHFDCCSNKAV